MAGPWLVIIPAKGRIKETAVELLRLAGDPALVRTTGNGTEFLVPVTVAEQFLTPAPIRKPKPRTSRATPKED